MLFMDKVKKRKICENLAMWKFPDISILSYIIPVGHDMAVGVGGDDGKAVILSQDEEISNFKKNNH